MRTLTDLEAKALDNVRNLGGAVELPVATDPKVGDLVAIYSRGAYRVVVVESIGKTNLVGLYTTDGAIKEARNIEALYNDPTRPARSAKQAAEMARSNHAFYVQESNPSTRQYDREADRAAEYARIAAIPVDEYVKAEADKAREQAEAQRGAVWTDFVHFTNKTINRSKVYSIEAAK